MSQTTEAYTNPLKRRRSFISALAATGVASLAWPLRVSASERMRADVSVYSEHFQSLSVKELCRTFQAMGVEGIDLTVRPGGHIDPGNVQEELPSAVAAAKQHDLKIMMLTTGINRIDDVGENVLSSCREHGIDRIKLGYFGAGENGLARRMDQVRAELKDIAAACSDYGVLPCVHVHSGLTVPSSGMMLHQLIRDIPPGRIGAYLDSHHMMMTGGAGGWKQAIELLSPWISMVALKNFQWIKGGRNEAGQQNWQSEYCPLADGIAPIPDFVAAVHTAGYRGFYNLHTEYRLPVDDCIRLTQDDFRYLNAILQELLSVK